MAASLLIEYLNRSKVLYQLSEHAIAYTAPEIAQTAHFHGRNFAKAVMVKVDDELSMIILPAHYHVGCKELANTLHANSVRLSTEEEFCRRFPRCEKGALPPFGHLFGVRSYIASVFNESGQVAFTAGSHSEIIVMEFDHFSRLAHAETINAGILPPNQPFSHSYAA